MENFTDLASLYIQANDVFHNIWGSFGLIVVGFLVFIVTIKQYDVSKKTKVVTSFAIVTLFGFSAYINIAAIDHSSKQRFNISNILRAEFEKQADDEIKKVCTNSKNGHYIDKSFRAECNKLAFIEETEEAWTPKELVNNHIATDVFLAVLFLLFQYKFNTKKKQ